MSSPRQCYHIAVLGCGFMGTAIIAGLLGKIPANSTPEMQYTAVLRSLGSADRVKTALKENANRVTIKVGDFTQAAEQADVIMLGVPPGELKPLLQTEGLPQALKGKVIISLLAGVSCDQVLDALTQKEEDRKEFHVLRVIPSIGAIIYDSVNLIAQTPHAGEEQQKVCTWLFEQIGGVHLLPENLMNEATAAGAACNALAIVAVDAIVDASVAEGLPRSIALKLAAQSMRSAGGLLVSDTTPESLKESMSVPRGITINAVLELEKGHARPAISDAVRNAIVYARSMA